MINKQIHKQINKEAWRKQRKKMKKHDEKRQKLRDFVAKSLFILLADRWLRFATLEYLTCTWENRKYRLENQMVRAIPFGKL